MLNGRMQPPAATTTRSFGVVVTDPAAYYADPAAIVADTGLTQRQQLRLLTEWAQDMVDRQVAADEGMTLETSLDDETNILRQINEAIERAKARPIDAAPGIIARAWRRLRP